MDSEILKNEQALSLPPTTCLRNNQIIVNRAFLSAVRFLFPHRLYPRLRMLLVAVAMLGIAGSVTATDLYYLVVDRSGSIMGSDLDAPIERAVSDEINTLPESTELRVVFFGNEALGYERWESLDLRAKAEFQGHFEKTFNNYFGELRRKGRDGEQTDLFDTVGAALEEINRDAGEFETIRLVVLSDGENTDDRSQNYRSWEDLGELAGAIRKQQPNSLMTVFTLGYDPKTPIPEGWVRQDVANPDEGFSLAIPPKADFEVFPKVAGVGDEVRFIAESIRGGGTITEVLWKFGDGAESTEFSPTHSYDAVDTYTVSLEVTGPGGSDLVEKPNEIRIQPSVPLQADFEPLSEEPFRAGSEVVFRFTGTGSPERISWKAGEDWTGTGDTVRIPVGSGDELEVVLSVERDGQEIPVSKSFEVIPVKPVARMSIDPANAEVAIGESFQLSAEESSFTQPVEFEWRVGAGKELTGSTVVWTPGKTGLQGVRLTVKDRGGVSNDSENVYVRAPEIPSVAFTVEPVGRITAGDTVRFVPAGEDAGSAQFRWIVEGEEISDAFATDYIFEEAGEFLVERFVSVPAADEVRFPVKVVVEERPLLRVEFEASAEKGNAPLEVRFTDQTEGYPVGWQWDFGDGSKPDYQTDRNPIHVYESPGEYTVRLRVTNAEGETSVSAEPMVIVATQPLPGWVKWAIGGGILLIILLIILKKVSPKPIKGRLRYSYGNESEIVELGGKRFEFSSLELAGWEQRLPHTIENKGGMQLLRNGVKIEQLEGPKEFEIDGAKFKYFPR